MSDTPARPQTSGGAAAASGANTSMLPSNHAQPVILPGAAVDSIVRFLTDSLAQQNAQTALLRAIEGHLQRRTPIAILGERTSPSPRPAEALPAQQQRPQEAETFQDTAIPPSNSRAPMADGASSDSRGSQFTDEPTMRSPLRQVPKEIVPMANVDDPDKCLEAHIQRPVENKVDNGQTVGGMNEQMDVLESKERKVQEIGGSTVDVQQTHGHQDTVDPVAEDQQIPVATPAASPAARDPVAVNEDEDELEDED